MNSRLCKQKRFDGSFTPLSKLSNDWSRLSTKKDEAKKKKKKKKQSSMLRRPMNSVNASHKQTKKTI